MTILTILLSILVFSAIVITVLFFIGLKVKKQENSDMEDNIKAIERFVRINKYKKYSRKSTPKVPTIKK